MTVPAKKNIIKEAKRNWEAEDYSNWIEKLTKGVQQQTWTKRRKDQRIQSKSFLNFYFFLIFFSNIYFFALRSKIKKK